MSAYSDLILAHASLKAYYRLAEATAATTLIDSGPNGLNGTLAGVTSVTGALANDSNTALTFDGTSAAGSVPDNNALDLGDVLSIEFWVKRSATQSVVQILVSKQAAAPAPYEVRFTAGNRISALKAGGGTVLSTSVITDQNWHHVVFTKNGATRNFYVDGVVDNAVVGTNVAFEDNTAALRIGTGTGGASGFPGSMDEVALYNAPLTADEVLQHYRTGLGAIRLADTTTTSESLSDEPGPVKAETVTTTDAEVADVGSNLTDAVTPSDALTTDEGAALGDSVTPSDFQAADVTTEQADVVTPDDVIEVGLGFETTESDTVTLSDSLTAGTGADLSLDDTASLSDFLSTHLETAGSGTTPSPGGVGVFVPVIKREVRLGLADVIAISENHEAKLVAPVLTKQQREEELLALV